MDNPLDISLPEAPRTSEELFAGIDEAGRGAWAGPVVAAAVVFTGSKPQGIRDSKLLSPEKRDALFDKIMERCDVGVGIVNADEVDSLGIKRATHEAMRRAVDGLASLPTLLLVDGNDGFQFEVPSEDIIEGDRKKKCIGAASIIAKVTRDRLMKEADTFYECYSFGEHKGYGTKTHQEELKLFGVCEIHRKSYKPILELDQMRLL